MSLIDRLFGAPAAPYVRDATPADAPALAALHARAFHQGWDVGEFERLLSERTVRGHVLARKGAEVLGFVLSHVVPPEAEILSIAVSDAERGQGLGRTLLAHHLGRLAGEGVTTSHLEVEDTNLSALALYRRLGYVVCGRRKGYYARAEGAADALLLRRDF